MTVRPDGVLAGGCARFVEQALLREEDKGPFRVSSFPGRTFRVRDLGERAADVNGSGFGDFGCTPRDRSVECVVELECARPVTPTFEPTAVTLWEQIARKHEELFGRDVAEHEPAVGQLAQRRNAVSGFDLATQRAQPCTKCVRDRLRATTREGPAVDVREQQQHQPERRARRLLEGEEGVRRSTCEQRAGRRRFEPSLRKALGGAQRGETKPHECKRVTRKMGDRPHQFAFELAPAGDERFHEVPVCIGVHAQSGRSLLERAPYERGRSVVERMRDSGGWFDQIEFELERAEERGGEDRRMDRGADVVSETRERQLRRACPAADRRLSFDDADRAPGLSERDRGSEAVRPRPDDNGV